LASPPRWRCPRIRANQSICHAGRNRTLLRLYVLAEGKLFSWVRLLCRWGDAESGGV